MGLSVAATPPPEWTSLEEAPVEGPAYFITNAAVDSDQAAPHAALPMREGRANEVPQLEAQPAGGKSEPFPSMQETPRYVPRGFTFSKPHL